MAPAVRFPRRKFSVMTVEIEDVSGRAQAVWFNQPYLAQHIKAGQDLYLYGVVELKQGHRRLMNPTIEQEDELNLAPVYRLPSSSGMNQKAMRMLMRQAISLCAQREEEVFSEEFRRAHRLAPRAFAVKNVHFPDDEASLKQARRRLCFEELVTVQWMIRLRRARNKNEAGLVFSIDEAALSAFEKRLPFTLTNAQKRCLMEIKHDVTSGCAMNRLIQGDVGCGKTVLAFFAMLLAQTNGGQAALMAPTEILARQHYKELTRYFGEENCALLLGSLSAAERKREYARVASGEASFIVGTNALIQKDVTYRNLAMVVCDEQHRFGVSQRARLFSKGHSPHMLVMSATPIPRTLSLIVFGDLDISVVDELPAGRQKVSTFIIPSKKEKDMLAYIRKELLEGKQAYFVCPVIEEDEEGSIISAEGLFELLKENEFADMPIALLHGQMTSRDKNAVMDGFARGEIKALISTTVIEVGVNVKNASIMVIYGADRFGLAQLHQLRGRVGRGEEKSYCFLFPQNDEAQERLRIMTKTNNGFEIAQYDFELRGPGDYLGKRQSGIAEARFSYALSNTLLLKETQTVLENDILPRPDAFEALRRKAEAQEDVDLTEIAYN